MDASFILQPNKKIYFLSDLHLGLKPAQESRKREKKAVRWLESIKQDAQVLFLLGDVFDYWYEYKRVVPKGFIRFLGKLAEIADAGIEIHYFTGNHDLWLYDYFTNEMGIIIHKKPFRVSINDKKFYLGHGDAEGPGDVPYKIMKSLFYNKTLQWLFSHLIHPDFSMWFGHRWSNKRRYSTGLKETFLGEDKEYQIISAKDRLKKEDFNYFIFGHRHIAYDIKLNNYSRVINLGEWITQSHYAVFDGKDVLLQQFENNS